MKNFDIFLGHTITAARKRLKSILDLDTLPTIDKQVPFNWDTFLTNVFSIIPDPFMPLLEVMYKKDGKLERFIIDRQYIYNICHLDIISTSRFYFKNKQAGTMCSMSSLENGLAQNYIDRLKHNTNITDKYLYKLFDVKYNGKSYAIPSKYSGLIRGFIISSKNCPTIYNSAFSPKKSARFYNDLYICESNMENLHFTEQCFSLYILMHIAYNMHNDNDHSYKASDIVNISRHITKLPNIIGRIDLINVFLPINEIVDVSIMDNLDDWYYSIDNNWSKCLSYICYKISRMVYPIFEALVITYLDKYYQDKEKLIEETASMATVNCVDALFKYDRENISKPSKLSEISENIDNSRALLYKDMCNTIFERFYTEHKDKDYYSYELDGHSDVPLPKPKLKPIDEIIIEADSINYRSIFFEERMNSNIEPFLPILGKL